MTKTFDELGDVDATVASMYQRIPTLKDTKFGYAYNKFYKKNYAPTFNELRDRLLDIQVSNALEDKVTGEIVVDRGNARGFKFSKEGLTKCISEERLALAQFNKKEIEISPYIISYVPPEITESEKEILTGVVL